MRDSSGRDMEESENVPSAPEDGLLATWRWNRNAREQVQLKQKIKDLPGLLKHGLHLRKKSVSSLQHCPTFSSFSRLMIILAFEGESVHVGSAASARREPPLPRHVYR